MPVISSNTLFHFTKKENLLGILESEFHPRFSLEKFEVGENNSFKLGIPMVSFCDIPLSFVGSHMRRYGQYGIGMSQEWAIKNRLNPVLYLHKDSEAMKLMNQALTSIAEDVEEIHKLGFQIHSTANQRDMLFKLFRFIKPFDEQKTINLPNEYKKKYYDEREWRYVPDPSKYDNGRIMLLEEEFADPLLSEENDKLLKAKLKFEPNDINYIIIQREDERLDLIQEIERIKQKYDDDTKKVLISKILTAERISSDF